VIAPLLERFVGHHDINSCAFPSITKDEHILADSPSMLLFDLVTRFHSEIPEFVGGKHDDLSLEAPPG
jgi:hypothetical protein